MTSEKPSVLNFEEESKQHHIVKKSAKQHKSSGHLLIPTGVVNNSSTKTSQPKDVELQAKLNIDDGQTPPNGTH